MQKGKNSVIIACTLELLNTLKEFSSKADQNEGYHLAKRLLMYDAELRERFIEKYGQHAYNEAVLHYSKTNLQQRAERKLKEEERKIREEAKLKIEELKAKAYAKQSDVATQKTPKAQLEQKVAEMEIEIRKIDSDPNYQNYQNEKYRNHLTESLQTLKEEVKRLN